MYVRTGFGKAVSPYMLNIKGVVVATVISIINEVIRKIVCKIVHAPLKVKVSVIDNGKV